MSQRRSRVSTILILAGALIIGVAVFITYYPALGNGFYQDEFIRLDKAARFAGLDYWAIYLDPRLQDLWYRPMVGVQWKVEYVLFGANFPLYHLVQIIYHAINCVLLYWLVIRLTRRWRAALVAALVYAVLPLTSMAVYWAAVHDPLAGVFCLLALLAWLDYLHSGSPIKLALTYCAFVAALMSKEVSLSLPVLFFLADILSSRRPLSAIQFLKRYVGFAAVALGYLALWLIVTTRSVFTQQIGVRVGEHILTVFLYYLAQMAFPWQIDDSVRYVWLSVLVLIMVYAVFKVDRRWILLGAAGTVPVLAVSAIPPHLSNPRYVYLPLMAWAVILSFVLISPVRALSLRRWLGVRVGLALLVALIVLNASLATNERIVNFGGFIRQLRLQFRPVYQALPNLAPDTLLYFFDTPLQSEDISGLMFLRYGANVAVGGVDRADIVRLRDHRTAYVCYLNDEGSFEILEIDGGAQPVVSPELPVRVGDSLSLVALDVASTQLKRGQPLAIVAYWKAASRVDKDYTVFSHLVDAKGETIAGYDSQPHKGNAPTSGWQPGRVYPDGLVIPIDGNVPAGEYRLEIGWYWADSGARLPVINAAGSVAGDKLDIGPFTVD
jgi:hypothetical protein